jgi:hypothetical protein
MSKSRISLADLADYEWVIGTPGANRRTQFDSMFKGRLRPLSPVATCSLPIIRLLLSHSDRLTLLTSYELMYEEDALAAVPFGPIEPSPSIGLTMRENWLPTRLQGEITAFIKRRVIESLNPLQELRRMGDDLAAQESRPDA